MDKIPRQISSARAYERADNLLFKHGKLFRRQPQHNGHGLYADMYSCRYGLARVERQRASEHRRQHCTLYGACTNGVCIVKRY